MESKEKKQNTFIKTLLWWKLDQSEFANQIQNYDSLTLRHSARKVSSLLLLFSSCLTLIFVLTKLSTTDALTDTFVMGFLAPFVYRGQRWALLAAMITWTLEKGYLVAHAQGAPIIQVIWWAIYMSQFYLAFRVETQRRKENHPPKINAA